jgi:DNA helicase-2/ATP-dependent DNA helicase PcrA
MMEPSTYQKAVFDAIRMTDRNILIKARAGSGKTTVIVQGTHILNVRRILFLAFNASVAGVLKGRIGHTAEAATFNAFGWRILRNAWPGIELDQYKSDRLFKAMTGPGGKATYFKYRQVVCRLADIARSECLSPESDPEELTDALRELVRHHDFSFGSCSSREAVRLTEELLSRMYRDTATADYCDQLYLPVCRPGFTFPRFDVVFVDEAQDLNLLQIRCLERMHEEGARIIAVGDDRQAIYGWRGADARAMQTIKELFNADEFTLPISYRCPVLVVKEAQEYVPDFEQAPGAEQGKVTVLTQAELFDALAPGDFVLSRINAPLVELAMDLLRRGVPVRMQGRDIGKDVEAFLRQLAGGRYIKFDDFKGMSVSDLRSMLSDYCIKRKRDIETGSDLSDDGIAEALRQLTDRRDTLTALMEGEATVAGVLSRVQSMGGDWDTDGRIEKCPFVVLSSIHKAKGLEADRVFILSEDKLELPYNQQWQKDQERNMHYVALTRARKELYTVREQKPEDIKRCEIFLKKVREDHQGDEYELNFEKLNFNCLLADDFGDDLDDTKLNDPQGGYAAGLDW